jgi:hypothetical protein
MAIKLKQSKDKPEPKTTDLRPRGLTTPEGNRRVNLALAHYDDAARNFAAMTSRFLDEYNLALIKMVAAEATKNPDIRDHWKQLQAECGKLRHLQEELLRAVTGAPAVTRP